MKKFPGAGRWNPNEKKNPWPLFVDRTIFGNTFTQCANPENADDQLGRLIMKGIKWLEGVVNFEAGSMEGGQWWGRFYQWKLHEMSHTNGRPPRKIERQIHTPLRIVRESRCVRGKHLSWWGSRAARGREMGIQPWCIEHARKENESARPPDTQPPLNLDLDPSLLPSGFTASLLLWSPLRIPPPTSHQLLHHHHSMKPSMNSGLPSLRVFPRTIPWSTRCPQPSDHPLKPEHASCSSNPSLPRGSGGRISPPPPYTLHRIYVDINGVYIIFASRALSQSFLNTFSNREWTISIHMKLRIRVYFYLLNFIGFFPLLFQWPRVQQFFDNFYPSL